MEHKRIREFGLFVAGALAGAAIVYLGGLDRRRLRLAVQRVAGPGRELADTVWSRGRDAQKRARRRLTSAASRLRAEHVSDAALSERVRAELGRASEHAGRVQVRVENGVVHLVSDLDDREAERLGTVALYVRGVREVAMDARPDVAVDARPEVAVDERPDSRDIVR